MSEKNFILNPRWGERRSFWSNKNDEKLRCLFLLSLVSTFHLWKALLYLFIGLDLGETTGEGKASYQGEIYQVYNNTPYTWLNTGKLCTSTQDMIHIFLGRLSC